MNSMESLVLNVTGVSPAKSMRLIWTPFLSFLALTTVSFGDPQINTIPWDDNFETYTNLTPLILGTNGWYGSSDDIVVQTNTVRSGTMAAMIPFDRTLTNKFLTNVPAVNAWFQMDVRPSLYNSTSTPAVDTNAAAMFYIDTNGNFSVVNGPETNEVFNSATNWVRLTELAIDTNSPLWVRINMYQDFTAKKWNLYCDGVLVTNDIGFINPDRTNFGGFDVYNGGATSYMDNVSVVELDPTYRPLIVIPSAISTNIYAGITPAVPPNDQTVRVINVWGSDIGFRIETNQAWITNISESPAGQWVVEANTTNELRLQFANTANWSPGESNATLKVMATNALNDEWGTQTVQVVVKMVALSNTMYVTPSLFSNALWRGETPSNETFVVNNLDDYLDFTYTIATGAPSWITNSLAPGTLSAKCAVTGTLSFGNTESWDPPGRTSWLDIVASNSEVMATQRVPIMVSIRDFSPGTLQVSPTFMTNAVWIGDTPTNRSFQVWNTGDISLLYGVATGAPGWITCAPTGGTIAAFSTTTVVMAFAQTWAWRDGQSNMTVVVSSPNGGATTTTNVVMTLNVVTSPVNYYVKADGTDINTPYTYTNWDVAAQTLTSAVFVANWYTNIASTVWVSNGFYQLKTTVPVSNVTIRSMNGPEYVTMTGGAMRGFRLAHYGAALNGLTITNCVAPAKANGGAVYVSTGLVVNCHLLRNTATNGGGVAVGRSGIVRDCLIWGNSATNGGGVFFETNGGGTALGAVSGRVENCTIASNYARQIGGGIYNAASTTGSCVNTVVYLNMADGAGAYSNWWTNNSSKVFFTNSCLSPAADLYGADNVDADPLFVDIANFNCKVADGSPCFNAGINEAWMFNASDLAGNIRIRFNRVDIGAYEWSLFAPGTKINGVPYEKIILINGVEPRRMNDIP